MEPSASSATTPDELEKTKTARDGVSEWEREGVGVGVSGREWKGGSVRGRVRV